MQAAHADQPTARAGPDGGLQGHPVVRPQRLEDHVHVALRGEEGAASKHHREVVIENGSPARLDDARAVGAEFRVEHEIRRGAVCPDERQRLSIARPERWLQRDLEIDAIRGLSPVDDPRDAQSVAASNRSSRLEHEGATVAGERPAGDRGPGPERRRLRLGAERLVEDDLDRAPALAQCCRDHLGRPARRDGHQAPEPLPVPEGGRDDEPARLAVDVRGAPALGRGAVAELPAPLARVRSAPRRLERCLTRAPPERQGRDEDVGEAVGRRVRGHPDRRPGHFEVVRIRFDHEDLVVAAKVVVLIARRTERQHRAVARQHREVEIAEPRRQSSIVLVEDRRRLSGRQVEPVDRPADARGPETPAPVVREVGLAATVLVALHHPPGVRLIDREVA